MNEASNEGNKRVEWTQHTNESGRFVIEFLFVAGIRRMKIIYLWWKECLKTHFPSKSRFPDDIKRKKCEIEHDSIEDMYLILPGSDSSLSWDEMMKNSWRWPCTIVFYSKQVHATPTTSAVCVAGCSESTRRNRIMAKVFLSLLALAE